MKNEMKKLCNEYKILTEKTLTPKEKELIMSNENVIYQNPTIKMTFNVDSLENVIFHTNDGDYNIDFKKFLKKYGYDKNKIKWYSKIKEKIMLCKELKTIIKDYLQEREDKKWVKL